MNLSPSDLIVTEAALQARGDEIAQGLASSVATFGGQLCTKPGIVLVPAGAAGARFRAALTALFNARAPEVLLTGAIASALAEGLADLERIPGVDRLSAPVATDAADGFRAQPVAYHAPVSVLLGHPELREEHFGPAVVIVSYPSDDDLAAALVALGGQLTATLAH